MSETFMVVEHIDQEAQRAILSSTKHEVTIEVYKPRYNYHFFKIKYSVGSVPEALSGNYSSLEAGIKAVKQYLLTAKETFAVRSDRLHKERQERHAAKANSSNS